MATSIHDDLLAPDVVQDPYPYLARLREIDPVHWNGRHEVWVITRYDDLVWIAKHPDMFSSAVAERDRRSPPFVADATHRDSYDQAREVQADHMAQKDHDEHAAMRRVVQSYFAPKAAERWRPRIRAVIHELLDCVQGQGAMDVLRDFAMLLDRRILCDMMGLPREDQAKLHQLSDQLCVLNRSDPDRLRVFVEGVEAFKVYLSPWIEARADNPGEDLLSLLVRGEQAGVYTRDQVLANASVMLIAGQETTANLIGNSLLAFLRHPKAWATFQQDLSPTPLARAVNECLRYDAPQKSIERIAAQTVVLRGQKIQEGERLRCFISAANRDPEAFATPDTFDIGRHPNRHVAFGFGTHH